jgi:hypothetical protein
MGVITMTKRLPKVIFAKVVREDKLSYISADQSPDVLVDMGEEVEIGTYELVDKNILKGTVQAVKRTMKQAKKK